MQNARMSLVGGMLFAAVGASAGDAPSACGADSAGVCTPRAAAVATSSSYLWTANDPNYGAGTVSKISVQSSSTPFQVNTYHEAARYASVTCLSDPVNGSKEGAIYSTTPPANLCADGVHGCCSRAETVAGANGKHQPVNLLQNRPVRTAIDANGDVWVANAGNGDTAHQSSITRIAGSLSECVERNGVPGIQTSSDFNGDGIIETDCNGNGIADDLTDVATTPCTGGHFQEFYGLDDECVLYTVNLGAVGDVARALALGRGATPTAAADAWVGTYTNGTFYRVDAATGAIKESVVLAPHAGTSAHPYGAVIDQFGILWAENVSGDGNCTTGCAFYFDTANTANQGMVAVPGNLAIGGLYGVALDGYRGAQGLIQQIWFGAFNGYGAYRYRPPRTGGFAALGNGTWALGQVTGTGQIGFASGLSADSRSPAFVWVAFDGSSTGGNGALAKIPADMPDGSNTFSPATNLFSTLHPLSVGTGIVADGSVWAINRGDSTLTRFNVDAGGNVTGPGTAGQVTLDDFASSANNFCQHPQFNLCKPFPDTNSDFTGFAFLTFTYPGIDRIFANGFD